MSGLTRSRNLLELLEGELLAGSGAARSPLLESVVVNYLLTVVYADLEDAIRSEIVLPWRAVSDARANSFITIAIGRVLRSIKCSEIAGVLGMFDEKCKRHFQELINDTPSQLAYDRLVSGRHQQAHSLGSEMTLRDFKADLEHCQSVLDAVAAAIRCDCEHQTV